MALGGFERHPQSKVIYGTHKSIH